MKKHPCLFITALLLYQMVGFSQTNPLYKYLPGDASMVMSFNLPRLAIKLSGESFLHSFIGQEMMKNPNPVIKNLFAHPAQNGINLATEPLLEASSTEKNAGVSINFFAWLKDKNLFNTMMINLFTEDSIHTYGTDKIVFFEKDMTIGWNDELVVITTRKDKKMMGDVVNKDTSRENIDKIIPEIKDKMKKEQREFCFTLLTPKSQNGFISNTMFTEGMNSAGDIKIWSSGQGNPLQTGMNRFAGLDKLRLFTGKNKMAIVNFEKGKILIRHQNYLDDALAEVYKKYPAPVLNTELIRRLPKGKLLALVETAFDTGMANELFQKTGMKQWSDSLRKMLPFDPGMATGVFNKTMMLALMKTDEPVATDSVNRAMGGIQVLLALPIADKIKFNALKNSVGPFWDSLQNSEGKGKMFKGLHPVVRYNDELFVLSLSPETATAFLNNPGNEAPPDWLLEHSQHPMIMRLDLREIFNLLNRKILQRDSGVNGKIIYEPFDQLLIYGGELENGSVHTYIELNFTDTTKNALKQLFELMNTMAQDKKTVNIQEGKQKRIVQEVTIENIKQEERQAEPPPPPPPTKKVGKHQEKS